MPTIVVYYHKNRVISSYFYCQLWAQRTFLLWTQIVVGFIYFLDRLIKYFCKLTGEMSFNWSNWTSDSETEEEQLHRSICYGNCNAEFINYVVLPQIEEIRVQHFEDRDYPIYLLNMSNHNGTNYIPTIITIRGRGGLVEWICGFCNHRAVRHIFNYSKILEERKNSFIGL